MTFTKNYSFTNYYGRKGNSLQSYVAANPKHLTPIFILILLISTIILLTNRDYPKITLLVVDILFCFFCAFTLNHKVNFLFFLHPVAIWIISQFYATSFLLLGDGPLYFESTKAVLPYYTNRTNLNFLIDLVKNLQFQGFYFGFVPNIIIPDFLYYTPSDTVYFYWQSLFHVILVSLCLVLAKQWKVIQNDFLFGIVLFSIISPSFFELGNAPTRHFFTFFSILLFYLSFIAIVEKFTLTRLFWTTIAVISVAVSKIAYFIPLFVFCLYYLLYEKKNIHFKIKHWLLLALLILVTSYTLPYFLKVFDEYSSTISNTGAATFSNLTNIPIVSFIPKYIFALLSPFPWQKAQYFIRTTYGGNPIHFIFHILSSLTGIYFFTRIILYGKQLFKYYPKARPLVIFGLIMSTSILGGATGFHSYLLIFFPFFMPLLSIKKYKLHFIVPIIIAISIETIYTVAISI